MGGGEKGGVEVMFHNKIGVHDVTVVKVSNIDKFLNWIRGFLSSNGLNYIEVSTGFKSVVSRYLDRDIKYFVFDIIEIGVDEKSVEPLIYRFKTEYLYYPLEITAASDVGQTYSRIGIFIITYGSINEDIVRDYGFNPRTGFKYYVEFSKDELKSVSPAIARLFNVAYVMYIDYYGSLNMLNKDLVIHGKDIHTPTLLDKLYLWSVKYLGPSIIYQFTVATYSEIINDYRSMIYRVFLTGILISLITGIFSVIYIISSLLKYLMKRYGLRTLGSYIASYIVSVILMAFILMLKPSIVSITAFIVIIVLGLSTLIYAVIKLIERFIF